MSISSKYLPLVSHLPRLKWLHYLGSRYAAYCNGSNWHVFEINGEKQFVDQLVKHVNMQVVVDVGCNVGDWTNYVQQKLPDASIHCFEPDPNNAKKLQDRFVNNNRILINPSGAGSETSSLSFYQYTNSEWNSFHKWENREILSTLTVPVVTLDDYCDQQNIDEIDLLKIDTEGHDFFVLQGASQLLKNGRVKFVQFEYGPNYISSKVFLREIFNYVSRFGNYAFFKLHAKGLLEIDRYQLHLDDFKLANFALVRADQLKNVGRILKYWP